ncbi:MAG: UDP-N-acetylmuramate--L-alanine ligase [Candidatus Omnitrophota bacterium]|nr:MAG: UDP-N-acetylmuramate--L-alanine ligase [Candidatus Omnitrophota bacterium]
MEEILSKVKAIHLVGIGGIGMSGLALLLKEREFIVSGSDVKDGYNVKKCKEAGIKVAIGHHPKNVEGVDLVCFSSAIREDNVEIQEAKKKALPVVQRAQLLACISQGKKTVAVTGSHGKTTTTSLLGFALSALGHNPAVFVGGIPLNHSQHAWWGEEYFVIEADESDGSFLYYEPEVSIITNIDFEHMDYYKDIGQLETSFSKFARNAKGIVIGCGDDKRVKALLSDVPALTYGFLKENRVRAQGVTLNGEHTKFDLIIDDFSETVMIPLLGEHNVLNALAVFSFFFYLGEDLKKVAMVLRGFKGTKRRWEIKARLRGVTFIEDYAHHPTEIEAVLKSARTLSPKRLLVIFEPHRFSRIQLLCERFSRCFSLADEVIVTDIYSAFEEKIEEINEKFLLLQIEKNFNGKACYIPKAKLAEEVPSCLEDGDIVLGLGAGEMTTLMEGIVNGFKEHRAKTEC